MERKMGEGGQIKKKKKKSASFQSSQKTKAKSWDMIFTSAMALTEAAAPDRGGSKVSFQPTNFLKPSPLPRTTWEIQRSRFS